jgi:hypothetical protein
MDLKKITEELSKKEKQGLLCLYQHKIYVPELSDLHSDMSNDAVIHYPHRDSRNIMVIESINIVIATDTGIAEKHFMTQQYSFVVMKFAYLMFFIAILFLQCTGKDSGLLSRSDVRNIKKEFTTDEILFFYECAFFLEKERNNKLTIKDEDVHVFKWNEDLEFCIRGNLKKTDSLAVLNAMEQINGLGLPVSLVLRDTARNIIYFDIAENLKKAGRTINSTGNYLLLPRNDNTLSFKVWIENNHPDKTLLTATLHELLNCMGLHGDQLSYMHSILYDAYQMSKYTKCTQLDVSALKLLYSAYIKTGLTRKEFKEKFKDIIPKTEVGDYDYVAFEKHVKETKYSFEAVELFQNMAFTSNHIILEPHILKFGNQPVLGFKDVKFREQYLEIIKNVIDTVNAFFDSKNILTIENDSACNIYAGNYTMGILSLLTGTSDNKIIENNPNMKSPYTCIASYFAKNFYYSIVEGVVKFENSYVNLDNENKYNYFFQSLLNILGVDFNNIHAVERGNINSVFTSSEYLTPADREFLTLYFSSVVKTGMLKWKLEEILKKYYPDLELSDNSIKDCYGYLDSIASTKPISDTAYRTLIQTLLNTGNGSRLYKLKPNPIVYKISDDLKMYKDTLQKTINRIAGTVGKSLIDTDTCDKNCRQPNLLVTRSIDGFSWTNITEDGLFVTINLNPEEQAKFFTCVALGFFFIDLTQSGSINLSEEALRFYYNPALVAGMDKNRVKAIFKKYYEPAPPKNRLIDMLNRLKTEKDRS